MWRYVDQARFEVHEQQHVFGRGKEPNASGGYVVHCRHLALGEISRRRPRDGLRLDRAQTQCFAAIESPESETTRVWLENCRESFSLMISEKLENDAKEREKKEEKPKSQADDLIDFYHLKSRKGLSQVELEDAVATDLRRATGFNDPDAAQTLEIPS